MFQISPRKSSKSGNRPLRRKSWLLVERILLLSSNRMENSVCSLTHASADSYRPIDRKSSTPVTPTLTSVSTGARQGSAHTAQRTAKSDGIKGGTGDATRDKCIELLYDALSSDSSARAFFPSLTHTTLLMHLPKPWNSYFPVHAPSKNVYTLITVNTQAHSINKKYELYSSISRIRIIQD